MPLYLAEGRWDAAQPLAQVLAALEDLVQRSGGRLVHVLQVDGDLSLTVETPDELSLFRIGREAAALGLRLRSRAALPRSEAEALDSAHRERTG